MKDNAGEEGTDMPKDQVAESTVATDPVHGGPSVNNEALPEPSTQEGGANSENLPGTEPTSTSGQTTALDLSMPQATPANDEAVEQMANNQVMESTVTPVQPNEQAYKGPSVEAGTSTGSTEPKEPASDGLENIPSPDLAEILSLLDADAYLVPGGSLNPLPPSNEEPHASCSYQPTGSSTHSTMQPVAYPSTSSSSNQPLDSTNQAYIQPGFYPTALNPATPIMPPNHDSYPAPPPYQKAPPSYESAPSYLAQATPFSQPSTSTGAPTSKITRKRTLARRSGRSAKRAKTEGTPSSNWELTLKDPWTALIRHGQEVKEVKWPYVGIEIDNETLPPITGRNTFRALDLAMGMEFLPSERATEEAMRHVDIYFYGSPTKNNWRCRFCYAHNIYGWKPFYYHLVGMKWALDQHLLKCPGNCGNNPYDIHPVGDCQGCCHKFRCHEKEVVAGYVFDAGRLFEDDEDEETQGTGTTGKHLLP